MTKTFKKLREDTLKITSHDTNKGLEPDDEKVLHQAAKKAKVTVKKSGKTYNISGDKTSLISFVDLLDKVKGSYISTDENFSHVGQNVSQKLSYDNWLKKVKGIEKGAHGIKGDEHTKLSKQWKDYRKEEVELEEGRMKELHTLIQQGKSAEEIAKIMKLDVKTIKSLMPKEEVNEVSPPGWGGSVKAMKKHADIDNPYALAWHMKNKGDKPHYKDKDGPPVKKDKYKDEQMEQVTEKLDVKWDKDKEGWFDKQGKRRYLGKGATTDLMRKAIDKAKASGDWIKPFDLQHGQRPEEKEIEMKKENKYFDTKSGSIEDSIKQMYQLESTEVTVNRKELDKLVKQYIAKGGTVTKLPPALKPGEDPDPERKAYKVKKVAGGWKILKASLREFIKTYNEHFLTNYAAEEFIEEEEK